LKNEEVYQNDFVLDNSVKYWNDLNQLKERQIHRKEEFQDPFDNCLLNGILLSLIYRQDVPGVAA
jgi:hypothetical protein